MSRIGLAHTPRQYNRPVVILSVLCAVLQATLAASPCYVDGSEEITQGRYIVKECEPPAPTLSTRRYVVHRYGKVGVRSTDGNRFKVYVLDRDNYANYQNGESLTCGYSGCGDWRTAWSRYVEIDWDGPVWVVVVCEVCLLLVAMVVVLRCCSCCK